MGLSALSSRERVLWEIAERYSELVDPLNGGEGIAGTGESLMLMPRTYTATVREFERLLGVMRAEGPVGLRWHLLEYHLKAERVVKRVPKTRTAGRRVVTLLDASGRPVTEPIIVVRRHPGAVEARAREAVAWIAARWELVSEPMLPSDLVAA